MFACHNFFFMNVDNLNINRHLLVATNVWHKVQYYGKNILSSVPPPQFS